MRDNTLLKTFALAAQFGFAVACPMLGFIGGGAWLDNRIGTTPWLLFLGIALGVLAAGGALYQLSMAPARKSLEKSNPNAPYKVETTSKNLGTTRADKRRRNGPSK